VVSPGPQSTRTGRGSLLVNQAQYAGSSTIPRMAEADRIAESTSEGCGGCRE